MVRNLSRTAAVAAGALALLVAAVRIAFAAESTLEELTNALLASDAPSLLAPITEAGRVGWECDAERAARARTVRAAELPPSPR